MNNLKNKIKNYNYSGNFLWHLIAPAVVVLLGIILFFCINFNLGLDFKGGSLATVVVTQDISDSKNYQDVKNKVEDICKDNEISIKVFQKVETSYYGNAITIKFDRISDELRTQLRNDLISEFYPNLTNQDDLNTFVKVDNFEGNIPNTFIISAVLAVLLVAVVGFIYVAARHGLCAGFITLMASILDVIVLGGLLLVSRVKLEMGSVSGMILISIYSLILNVLFFNKVNENVRKEIYAKSSNLEVANSAVKDNVAKNFAITGVILVFSLLIGVVPAEMVRSVSLPVMLGSLAVLYSSLLIVPGLWSKLYIRNAKKLKIKKEEVIVEDKISDEEILNEPEVIEEKEL